MPRLFKVLTITAIIALVFSSVATADAQRRRTRRSTKARPNVTAAKIREDVVGKEMYGVPFANGINKSNWTFAAEEWKEVDVLETSTKGNTATVVIFMRTGGVNAELAGKLRLHYERVAGDLVLGHVENLTAKITPYAAAQTEQRSTLESPQIVPEQPQPALVPIARGAYSIGAGRHQYFNFQVNEGQARLLGEFRATGGRNDIEVYVLDEFQYENFANGHRTPTRYNSGRVTVGRINVALGPGRYVLILNNGYSVITPKAVAAEIFLQY